MALGLRLVSVLPHDLLEGDVQPHDLGHDVDTAHDDLIEVSVSHQVRGFQHGILKTRPHSVERGERET